MSSRVEQLPHDWRHRHYVDGIAVASEDDGDIAVAYWLYRQILASGHESGSIAHIGMGFAALAWMLGQRYTHTFYELHPVPPQHLPPWVTPESIIAGDYRDTLTGYYDIIAYDIPKTLPPEDIRAHLNPGGVLVAPWR